MMIRKQTDADAEAVDILIDTAFAGMPYASGTEARIMAELWRTGAANVALIAEAEDGVLGQIAFSPVTIDGRAANWHCLGPLAVHPAWQRSGIGTSLVEAGLASLRAQHSAGCVVVGDPRYYRRFGFQHKKSFYLTDISDEFFLSYPFTDELAGGLVGLNPAFSAR